MKTQPTRQRKERVNPYKLGDNRTEPARKLTKIDRNFAQSKDVHEDRGRRQMKLIHSAHTLPHPHDKVKK
jgi:hypothetical protein